MSSPARVSSKVKLAEALGISPPTLYSYLRLPDSPPPKNGYYYVAEFRRFINRKRKVMGIDERQRLQLELLKAKVEREKSGLDANKQSERKRWQKETADSIIKSHQVVRANLDLLKNELCPKFEGLHARQMYSLWVTREREIYRQIFADLTRAGIVVDEKHSRPVNNVVLFERKAATG